MQPPVPAEARDTSNLDVEDAQVLAGANASSAPLCVRLSTLNLPLSSRRSERAGGRVSLERAVDVVTPIMTATAEWVAADGYVERQTFVPSAGGRHPLTALVLSTDDDGACHQAWAVSPSVSPRRYAVTRYEPQIQEVLRATTDALRLTQAPSAAIVLLARFRRTLSKYPDGETLVWRDSGVFLGSAHLVAASLGLRSCIAGVGRTTSFTLDGSADTLVDVGAIVLSERE